MKYNSPDEGFFEDGYMKYNRADEGFLNTDIYIFFRLAIKKYLQLGRLSFNKINSSRIFSYKIHIYIFFAYIMKY